MNTSNPTLSSQALTPAHTAEDAERGTAPRGQRGGLGNNTKSTPHNSKSPSESRAYNYRLKDLSGQILGKGHRVYHCMKCLSFSSENASISISTEGKAQFDGVAKCGSVWSCPVCSSHVTQMRAKEIKEALRQHRANGGISVLVTFTIPHFRSEKLKENMDKLAKALSRFKGRSGFKKIKEEIDYIGQIRALECNHGKNGWHPHTHEIWFLNRSDITPDEISDIRSRAYKIWASACKSAGLRAPSFRHGIDIQFRDDTGSDAVGSYIAKWGDELTKSHKKTRSKSGSRTPWMILSDLHESYSYADAQLWREFSKAMKGRAQIFWSRGLKDWFEIDEFTDQELLETPAKHHFRDLTLPQWLTIVKAQLHATALDVAENMPLMFDSWLDHQVELCKDTEFKDWKRRRELNKYIQENTINWMKSEGIYNENVR